ncbi:hypothetical protein TRVA0_044S00364 [Trichomonascus vanleenenianus]|uniref:uncharacterized protein n=1 Tax=Trichomonascus vanleenenianus TaxID=2268995 RepID=UPI003EC9EE96
MSLGTLRNLPNEILDEIVAELPVRDLLALQATSRFLRSVAAKRLWANVELNLTNLNSSPIIRDESWISYHKRVVDFHNRSRPWMVIRAPRIRAFFAAYKQGLLRDVLDAIKTVNIVESIDVRLPVSGATQKTARELERQYSQYFGQLDPQDLPSLQLLRICSTFTRQRGQLPQTTQNLLQKFSQVEKYIWATRIAAGEPSISQFSVDDSSCVESLTSLNFAVDDLIPQFTGEAGSESDLRASKNVVESIGSIAGSLTSLTITMKTGRLYVDAETLKGVLSKAPKLARLTLSRVEVVQPPTQNEESEAIEWIPRSLSSLRLVTAVSRGRSVNEVPKLSCGGIRTLYVDCRNGTDSDNLRHMEFHSLARIQYLGTVDVSDSHDVELFTTNKQLRSVVYNCSSSHAVYELAENCGPSLEAITLMHPTDGSEKMRYEIDPLMRLAEACKGLKSLTLYVSAGFYTSEVQVIKMFARLTPSLEKVHLIADGPFSMAHCKLKEVAVLNDGYYRHYFRQGRRALLYEIDVAQLRH